MKILSITEAFSMQPSSLYVCRLPSHTNDKCIHNPDCIKEIKLERTEFISENSNKLYDVYIGYDQHGRKQFQYFANTVNVFYYYPEES
jgi:hypothetical protein